MGDTFFTTLMGRKFYEGSVPRVARALERIAYALEATTRAPKTPEDIAFFLATQCSERNLSGADDRHAVAVALCAWLQEENGG